MGFGLFRLLEKRELVKGFSMAENVIVQTTAVATATMPLAAGALWRRFCHCGKDFNKVSLTAVFADQFTVLACLTCKTPGACLKLWCHVTCGLKSAEGLLLLCKCH